MEKYFRIHIETFMYCIITLPLQLLCNFMDRWALIFLEAVLNSWSVTRLVTMDRSINPFIHEPPHDKTNKMTVRLAKTQISLGIRPVRVFAMRSMGS